MAEGITRDEYARRNTLTSVERRQGPDGEWWALVVDGDGQFGVAMVSSDDPNHANGQRPDDDLGEDDVGDRFRDEDMGDGFWYQDIDKARAEFSRLTAPHAVFDAIGGGCMVMGKTDVDGDFIIVDRADVPYLIAELSAWLAAHPEAA